MSLLRPLWSVWQSSHCLPSALGDAWTPLRSRCRSAMGSWHLRHLSMATSREPTWQSWQWSLPSILACDWVSGPGDVEKKSAG